MPIPGEHIGTTERCGCGSRTVCGSTSRVDIDVASAEGKPPAWAGEQLIKNFGEYEVPADAQITPNKRDNRIEVRVQFVKPIEFPGYTYNYEFDQTAISTAFLDYR